MACPSCKSEHSGWGRYCSVCGAEQHAEGVICPGCGLGNSPGARFCGGCGLKLARVLCSNCGAWNPATAARCSSCHQELPPPQESLPVTGSSPSRVGTVDISRWKLERQAVIRVAPEGFADLVRATPGEAERYHQGLRRVLEKLAADYGATVQPGEDGGAQILFPLDGGDPESSIQGAVGAARVILADLRQLSEDRKREGWSPVPVRIAVHLSDLLSAGPGRPGTILARLECEGTDLIKLCPPDAICVGDTVEELVQSRYLQRPLGLVGRASSRRQGAWLLSGPRARLPGSEISLQEPVPLAGRERELAHLKRRWTEVSRGSGSRLITLLAPPGMGRGRLIESVLTSMRSQGSAYALTCCEEAGSSAPFLPIIDLVQQLMGFAPEDDEAALSLRLAMTVRRAVAAEGWAMDERELEDAELTVMLGELLGVEVSNRRSGLEPGALEAEGLRQRMFHAVLRLLRGLSQEAPRALVLEDVHLADSATLDLLHYLGGVLRGSGRLLVVCTASPALLEARPHWGKGWWRHEVLTLSPVGAEAMGGMLSALLGTHARGDLIKDIVAQAAGRPAMAELLARAWQEERRRRSEEDTPEDDEVVTFASNPIGPDAGGPGAGEGRVAVEGGESSAPSASEPGVEVEVSRGEAPAASGVSEDKAPVELGFRGLRSNNRLTRTSPRATTPARVRTVAPPLLGELKTLSPGLLWQRRLARLGQRARLLLELASVIGRTFKGELLTALWENSGQAVEALEPLLGELKSEGFLKRRVEPRAWQVSWRFRGTLEHRTVYESIPHNERQRLHRRLARLVEERKAGASVHSSYALVAFHYDQGEDSDHALRYYVLAGRMARRALALTEGERLLARAMHLLKESGFADAGGERIALHLMRGQILGLLGERSRGLEELETALELARLRQDHRQECEILMALCDQVDPQGDRQRLRDLALLATDRAHASRNPRLLIRGLRLAGWEHVRSGEVEQGRAALEDAVRVGIESGSPMLVAEAMDALGAFYYLRGNYGLAVRGYEDLFSLLKRSLRTQPLPRL